ncbi:MAG: hypothetical protein HYV67_04725 [Candidatus Taylorbacteria bacterium]|nr:hypothetical protein [Candidatus Taylorbacteria bacterium]
MNRQPLLYSRIVRSGEPPPLARFLVRNKIVRTETQAIYFLLFVVAVSSIFAVYFFLSLNAGLSGLVPFLGAPPISQLP